MLYVGVDISSESFDVCFYLPEKKKMKSMKYKQDREGFREFLKKLNAYKDEKQVGMEATGSYHSNLYGFLKSKGIDVQLLDPYTLSKFMKAMSRSKTDKKDAKSIAVAMYRIFDLLSVSQVPEEEMSAFRDLVRMRSTVVANCSDLQRKLKSKLKIHMPELLKTFRSVSSPVLLHLLSVYPSREEILANEEDAVKLLSSHRNWSEKKAREVIDSLKDSIGKPDTFGTYSTITSTFIAEIKLLKDHVEALNEEIKRFLRKFPDNPLRTIPGIAEVTEAEIVSEVGDIDRFSSAKAFVSYIGLDPVIKQSGNMTRGLSISKKGNKHLRRTFYHLAKNLIANTEKYRNKYEKMKKRGVKNKVALIATARAAAEMVYQLLKNNVPFDLSLS